MDPDGSGFRVRAERDGDDAEGWGDAVIIVATDDCGNESAQTSIGFIHVPHAQPHPGSCLLPGCTR